ncbi:hypothetical protein ACFO3J_27925 [Streptomyces polygonati]|uniref:Peptidase S8/S53 domain-containing protein n=1 Tax=Streptomyces polygonati TaxID=1617087 RepID=A0ABV8HU92_9ACTN
MENQPCPLSSAAFRSSPVSASSAATCWGYTCHDYHPYHFGCTDNISTSAPAVALNGTILAYVYNRYSSGGNAN